MQYLLEKNYTIIEHDWKSNHRDIDIIALDHGTVVFVEVKTRSSRSFMDPIQALNYNKRKNLIRSINHYIKFKRIDNKVRFDAITVVGSIGYKPEIEHYQDIRLF